MTIDTKQLYFILDNTPHEQNVMLVGPHGIGKSRILEDYYSAKGMKVVSLFLGQMADSADLIGLPEKNEATGKTDFMLPYWFPNDGKPIVLFLDELNRARNELLQSIFDLTLNRKLAGKSLPPGSRIISAVNNGPEYQLTDLDPALISRFNIYFFSPTVEDWIKWAFENQIDERIINFISENPELLDSSDVDIDTQQFERTPDRRSWERTSRIISNFPKLTDVHKPIISGIIGSRVTSLFFRFVNEHNLPSAKTILCGDFETVCAEIEKLSVADTTIVNTWIFRFLEQNLSHETSAGYSVNILENKTIISENLEKYFDFLGEIHKRELQSHFASLCSAEKYPETLYFISTECKKLYENIMAFILEL